MNDITIIYYTDNSLEKGFEKKVQDYLLKAAKGKRIVSVSQKPLDFGDNVCVGDIGRSHHSLFYQTLVGAKEAKTKYIALAEHDCLYTSEHFNWRPPDDKIFWYNVNHWLVQWGDKHSGMYSYYRRKVMSQLICDRKLYIEAIEEKLKMLDEGFMIRKGQPGACEPGVCDNRKAFLAARAKIKDMGKEKPFQAQAFRTKLPNLDIRHKTNFSGGRRARDRRFFLKHWGSFHKVMGEVPDGKWYQEAVINGVKMPTLRKKDTNQKRWERLIRDLIPFKTGENLESGEGRTFIDLGGNAGFYCRKMADRGFKTINIEVNPVYCRHAAYWEDCNPKGVKTIPIDINEYDLPTAQLVLMANIHYWLTPEQVNSLVAKLRRRALYVIVVGRYSSTKEHKSRSDLESVKQFFDGWEPMGARYSYKHYSVIFKNPDLKEADVNELWQYQQLSKSRQFYPSFSKFINTGKGEDYLAYLKWRKFRNVEKIYKSHEKLIQDIKENGIKEPLTMGENNQLKDGDHRYIIAKELGIRKVIWQH